MTLEGTKIIAIPGTAPSLDAPMESKFGRAALLLLVDPVTMEFEALENPARNAGGGAGIEAAQLLSKHGVRTLIAEKLGPKAEAALEAAGIGFIECMATGTVREALDRISSGEASSAMDGGGEGQGQGGRGPGEGRGMGQGGGRGMGRGGGGRGRGGGGRGGWGRGQG